MRAPLRILHVIPWVATGGVERRRLQLACGLDPNGYDQRLVCLTAREPLRSEMERHGMRVDTVGGTGSPWDFRSISRVANIAKTYKPDIIHGAVFEGVTLATLGGLVGRVPRTIIEEIDYPIHRSWRGSLLLRVLAMRADRCVAVSPPVGDYLQSMHIPARKITTIVNGIRSPREPSAAEVHELRTRLAIPEDATVVVSVGRLLDQHKRFSDLIKAIPLLQALPTPVHLLIVGDGPDRGRLESLVEGRGLRKQVHFLGHQPDVGPALRSADIFALGSERESFGLVLAEAMFFGLPVVSTFGGAIPFVVENGRTGILVEVGAVAEFARAIEKLAASAELRQEFGEAGKLRAKQRFSAERYVADVADLYSELASVRADARVQRSTSIPQA